MTEINVRISKDGDLKQLVGSTWDGRNMARCDDCGVLYDHRVAGSGADSTASQDQQPAAKLNCPDCGARNCQDRETCSYCEAPLNDSSE